MAKHWNDYLRDIKLEDSGEYNYRGSFYALNEIGPNLAVKYTIEEKSQKFAVISFALSLLALLFSVIGGLFPATGAMTTWYVILPFGLTIAFSGLLFYHYVKLIKGLMTLEKSSISHLNVESKKGIGMVRGYIYEKTWPRIRTFNIIQLVCGVLTLIAETLHLVLYGKGEHFGGAIILLISVALSSICGGLLLYRYNGVKWLKMNE